MIFYLRTIFDNICENTNQT